MITIHKYELIPGSGPNNSCQIGVPKGAVLLSVGTQMSEKRVGGVLHNVEGVFVWMLVDDQAMLEVLEFHAIGTGHEISPEQAAMRFVGTVHFKTSRLVFHVFGGRNLGEK